MQFLNDKPHEKGIINSIQFMPWSNGTQFATAGCDHGVVLWSEKEGSDRCWQPHLLHRVLHSSSVSGVAGIPHKQLVLSSGCWQSAGHILDSVLSHVLSSLAVGKTLPNKNSYENHSWKLLCQVLCVERAASLCTQGWISAYLRWTSLMGSQHFNTPWKAKH